MTAGVAQQQMASVATPGAAEKFSGPSKAETEREDEVEETRWRPVLGLYCRLTVDLPLPRFKVVDLLQLSPGSVIATNWRMERDVPLRVNGTLIGWSEFEVVGNRLAVRVTELA